MKTHSHFALQSPRFPQKRGEAILHKNRSQFPSPSCAIRFKFARHDDRQFPPNGENRSLSLFLCVYVYMCMRISFFDGARIAFDRMHSRATFVYMHEEHAAVSRGVGIGRAWQRRRARGSVVFSKFTPVQLNFTLWYLTIGHCVRLVTQIIPSLSGRE